MQLAVDNAGKVAEWSNAPDSKSGVQLCCTVGSNPTLSAKILKGSTEFFLRGLFVWAVRFALLCESNKLERIRKPQHATTRE